VWPLNISNEPAPSEAGRSAINDNLVPHLVPGSSPHVTVNQTPPSHRVEESPKYVIRPIAISLGLTYALERKSVLSSSGGRNSYSK
jgi:hypothetical protein